VDWFLPLTNGEQTIGPMSLFNSQIFFATFAPAAANASACNVGSSRVWGMHYLIPLDPTARVKGGQGVLPKPNDSPNTTQVLTSAAATGSSSALVFGVSIAQQPTCTDTSTNTVSNDFLGYSATETTLRTVTPGKFQLLMLGGNEDTGVNAGAEVHSLDLQTPPSAARVDSWAALIE
jgi:hypothetical protein